MDKRFYCPVCENEDDYDVDEETLSIECTFCIRGEMIIVDM